MHLCMLNIPLKNIAFWFTHVGLILTMLFAGLGHFEFQKLHVRAFKELPENIAICDKRNLFELPFRITLKNFEAEFYDNHQPKSYKADLVLQNHDTKKEAVLQVNHPARFMGYDIYLSSYDRSNPDPDYAILLIVYDPWVYTKYVGIIMLLIGLFLYIWKLKFVDNRVVFSFILLLGLGFLFIPFSPYLFGGKNLVPALQSWWFVPHIAVYMFAYASLSIACLLGVYMLVNRKDVLQYALFSLQFGTYLMGIGLLFGALWAKEAWGNFWSWDLKEIWAGIAWIAFLMVLHFNYVYKNRRKTLSILIIIAFLLLQMCWFGINYLPKASQSLHVY